MTPRTAASLLACLLATLAGSACSDAGHGRPNLLLVVVDTLRADAVGVYGAERDTTPAIDRLAKEGAVFERAFSHSGWTLPAVTSLLTGRLPHEHRVGRDPREGTAFGSLGADVRTLAECLRDGGYSAGAIVNNTFLAPAFGLQRGFAAYDYRGATRDDLRSAEASVDAALRWLEGREEPWFLFLHVMEPHLSYDPAPDVRGTFTGDGPAPVEVPFASAETVATLYDGPEVLGAEGVDYVRALYDEEVRSIDRALERLLRELDVSGVLDGTLLVVTADHGEEFFDHGSFEHGHTLYSELTRVPLILRGPGVAPGRHPDLVSHRDLFRGLLNTAGVPLPAGVGGVDLLALARGECEPEPVVVSENTLYGPPLAAITDGTWRFQLNLASGAGELWRLDARGVERERATGPEAAAEELRLRGRLRDVRGHLRPVEAISGPHIPDMDVFRELKSLGYIGGQ